MEWLKCDEQQQLEENLKVVDEIFKTWMQTHPEIFEKEKMEIVIKTLLGKAF